MSSCADDHIISNGRMPLAPFRAQPPKGDTVIHKNIVANFRCFTNHHAHTVIDKKPASDFSGGMDFDSCQPAEKVGKNSRHKLKTAIPQPMGNPVSNESVNSRITNNDFKRIPGSRIFFQGHLNIFFNLIQHRVANAVF